MSKQEIYNRLRQGGLSEAGALGMMGNWDCESNLEPNRLQGDFSPFRTLSKSYVQGVTNGSISRQTFGYDGKGFGLYQLTYFSRKLGYYDYWQASGKALDSAELQTDYALIELKKDYPVLLEFLRNTNDLYQATKRICVEFERPAVNNVDARYASAKRLQYELDLEGADPDPEPEPPKSEFWPPRTLCKSMIGADVEVLQAVLKARGNIVTNPDGIFGSYLEERVKEFQKSVFPDDQREWDGIVGNKTWTELLKR